MPWCRWDGSVSRRISATPCSSWPATAPPPTVKNETPSEAQPGESATEPPPTTPPQPGPDEVPGNPPEEAPNTAPTLQPAEDNLEGEQRQALEQWLGKIPDNPGELLRRKFWYEQQQHQDQEKTR